MISSEEYSPFLKWKPEDPIVVDSVSEPFVSLVSMVRDGYTFDEELVSKASTLLYSIDLTCDHTLVKSDLLNAYGQGSPNPAAVHSLINSLLLRLLFFVQHADPYIIQNRDQNPFIAISA
ncbi:hypothetical protein BLNAU_3278 [Blattamonas nauphoetae]|uniref:Uncharacterized protein n=1 Tax=Blattamonas nauphoetae TaxID=2049346 RepID=A0ABQ9YDK0_9EUKA|nr:hypothetical protein BLNAU_3278 [Blattamonas nauphoetae]